MKIDLTTFVVIGIIVLIIASFYGAYLVAPLDAYGSFLAFLYSLGWRQAFAFLKVFLILLNFIFLGFIIYTLWKYEKLPAPGEPRVSPKPVLTPRQEILRNWEEIERLASSPMPSEWNMAILRADALLDDILQERRTEGANLPERLHTLGSGTIPSIDQILSAHRLRNMIAHEPLEQHPRESIARALEAYARAFRELGLMG